MRPFRLLMYQSSQRITVKLPVRDHPASRSRNLLADIADSDKVVDDDIVPARIYAKSAK